MEQETSKTCKCCGRTLDISNFKHGRWVMYRYVMNAIEKHRAENRQLRLDKTKQKIEDERAENRKLCLADFSPRELMCELKRRGYDGTLTYTETHTINLATIH